jgi:alpha-tubulin suppressor-like RCC1 family protein
MIRIFLSLWFVFSALLCPVFSATVPANFTSAGVIPVTSSSYTASGNDVALSLTFAPTTGTHLIVVKNTGIGFITGQFTNLAQGQTVDLSHAGKSYRFVANYYGGTGNDLVLHWADQNLAAWGDNSSGQLGNNSPKTGGGVPVLVTQNGVLAGKTVVSVSAGSSYSLALCSDGTVTAWGANSYGRLGNNSTTDASAPGSVTQDGVLAGKTVVSISAGTDHGLALCSDGTIAAWGSGQLVNNRQTGSRSTYSSVPVLVEQDGVLAGKTVVSISAGYQHNLALCSDGTVVAWGANTYGQLGNNNPKRSSSVPVLVTQTGVLAGKTVVSVAASHSHSLALCTDGTIAAWGRNNCGQLGNDSTTDASVPVLVSKGGVLSGKIVVSVAAGGFHNLALCSDGTIAAWGENSYGLGPGRKDYGKLGNNSTSDYSSGPVLVSQGGVLSGKTVVSVSAGYDYSLALCSDGTVAAWGKRGNRLGNNGTTDGRVPALVSQDGALAGNLVVSISAGSHHSLAIANVSNSPNQSIVSLSAGSSNTPSPPLKKTDESPLPAETREAHEDREQNDPFAESAVTTPGNMRPGQKTASPTSPTSPASKGLQMAEADPEAFLEMLRKRVFDDLIKERNKESCAGIAKYEGFVAKIPDKETRSDAQAMLKEIKENYSKTWHLLYPIPLSERWHEIKGNPVARKDFAEILEMAGVSACDREDVPDAMKPVDNLNLFGPVNYLDPVEEAVIKLSKAANNGYKFKSTKATSFNRVESAGIPLDTFHYYSYDVESPPDSVNRLFFMVDKYKRVVAFQEVIESPKTIRLSMHTNTRSVYNFMQMRRKGTGSYEIAYMERSSFSRSPIAGRSYSGGGNVCVLTSELIDSNRIPREWVRLHLPRKLAEVCLYICKEVDD